MRIGDIARIITNRKPPYGLTVANYISTENMLPNFGGITSASSLPTTNATDFRQNDILLSNIRPYFKKIWFARFDGGCSTDVVCLRSKSNECLPQYLFYLLNSNDFIDTYVASSKGTKMPRGDKKALLDYEFDLPRLDEQRHIVSILGSFDDKVENNEAIVRKSHELAMLYYNDLFGNENAEIVLSAIADITMGQAPDSSSYNESGDGMAFYQGRSDFGLLFPTERLYTTAPSRCAKAGDVLFSVRAPVGDVNIANRNCCIGRGLAAIRNKLGFANNATLFYALLASHDIFDVFNGGGTVFGSISKVELNTAKLKLGNVEKLKEFDHRVSPLFYKCLSANTENAKLIALKQAYLKKFFN